MAGKIMEEIDSDLSLCLWEVALRANDCVYDVRAVNVVLCFCVPFCEACECVFAVQTADQDDDVGSVVVLGCEGLVAFSTACVHQCELWCGKRMKYV